MANALLVFAMHKPWAMCKPGSLTWSAVSLGQVSPHPTCRDCVALLVAHVKDTGVKRQGELLFSIMMLFLASLNKEGSRILFYPAHHFSRHVGKIVFASFFHTEMPILWLRFFFCFCCRIIRWPSTAVSARPVSSREFFVAQKGNTFYSLHETFIVNVYYSESLYCTIKLVLSKLLDVHVFELLSTR